MELIVLGLLMYHGCAIYSLQKIINDQFNFATSGSMGNIQATLKKLLAKEMITYEDRLENGVMKKIYFITDLGKEHFIKQISTPIENKTKNMELSKLVFMGFTKAEKRETLIDSYIKELEEELAILIQIQAQHEIQQQALQADSTLMESTLHQLKELGGAVEFMSAKSLNEINFFQVATVDYGISRLTSEIEWFRNLKAKMKNLEDSQ